MGTLYNHPDVYDERFTQGANEGYKRHYALMFKNAQITNIHDCSFGTGCLTLCLTQLGYAVSGSDISEPMLERGRGKAVEMGIHVPLTACDFRELSRHVSGKFSCVMSTGNSIVHVDNRDVARVLREMDSLVADGGYLYLDVRNWDRALEARERFQVGTPFFKEDGTRINYFQVWDYNPDSTVTINILQVYERENREIDRKVYEETLYPVSREFLLATLSELGYGDIAVKGVPCFAETPVEDMGWYCLLARKVQPDMGNCFRRLPVIS